ncbi:MAG: hypothetical protein A3D28_01945 [Omnitrophica bacterium RIFCSPHIGHO2_02_FULL_63_14]|nr:MAG: hypothetical protein A3D28_01945 [Omnitrophica bacterium RIFCSPHIGHO2_02_FULL_63_14]
MSFSRGCWNHTDRQAYPQALREGLAQSAGALTLNLKRASLENVDLSQRDLSGSAFSQTRLNGCSFVGSVLAGCDFTAARVSNCDFVGADAPRASFAHATISLVSFSHADLTGALLADAHLGETDFTGALLAGATLWNADLTGAKHIKKRSFGQAAAGVSEKDALPACETYRSLKHYFYGAGLYEDAGWAAYRERRMERLHYRRTGNPLYLPSLLMDILSGYTEKPNRVILSSLGAIILYGLLYYALQVPQAVASPGGSVSVVDSVYFSFITFTTVGFGDFVPQPVAAFRLLVVTEAFMGPFMIGLYLFTLTRRYAAG